MKCVRVLITGKVQGVGFRYFAKRRAVKLGLVGWVRNLDGGGVDAVFQGENDKVDEMLSWCEEGSPLSSVDGVDVRGEQAGEYDDFSIV